MFTTNSINAHNKHLVVVGDPSVGLPHALGHMINDTARSKVKHAKIYLRISELEQNVTAETLLIG